MLLAIVVMRTVVVIMVSDYVRHVEDDFDNKAKLPADPLQSPTNHGSNPTNPTLPLTRPTSYPLGMPSRRMRNLVKEPPFLGPLVTRCLHSRIATPWRRAFSDKPRAMLDGFRVTFRPLLVRALALGLWNEHKLRPGIDAPGFEFPTATIGQLEQVEELPSSFPHPTSAHPLHLMLRGS